MLVTDGEGLPIGLLVESAQKSEVRLAEATLATVRVARRRGRARTRPERLTCDRGYDSRAFRRYLTRRGIRHAIPLKPGSRGGAGHRPVTRRRTGSGGRWSARSRGSSTTGGSWCVGSVMWGSTEGSCCSRWASSASTDFCNSF